MVNPIRGLYAIVDNTPAPHLSHREIAGRLLKGGAGILQLRMKGVARSVVREVAEEIVRLKGQHPFLFIINDHLEIVSEVNADGYHGGEKDPGIEEARRQLGPDKIIGHSTHSLEEGLLAQRQGANYIAFGAIFPTKAKGPEHPVVGVERLRHQVAALSIPVVAIGGIGRNNIKEVLATGVASVAMISALVGAADITGETKFLRRLIDVDENRTNDRRI